MNKSPVKLPLRFAWIWVFGFVLLGLMVKPVFRAVKFWRAGIYLSQTAKDLSAGNVEQAKEQCLLSLALRPGHVDAVRMLARISDAKRDPLALSLWMNVLQSLDCKDTDRMAAAEAAMRVRATGVAEEQLQVLLSRQKPSKETYNLAGLVAVAQGRASMGREWFHKALDLDPRYERAEVNLARAELMMAELDFTKGRGKPNFERLKLLGENQDEWGLESLRILVDWGCRFPTSFPFDKAIAEKLKTHPLAKMAERCQAVDWEIRSNPQKTGEIVNAMTASSDKLSSEDRRELGAWLNRHGLFERTLLEFPVQSTTPDDLFLVQLDALAALKRWKEISDMLSNDVLKSDPMLRSLYQARAAKEMGDLQLFELGWKQAVLSAKDRPQALRYLAHYAEKLGQFEKSVELYEKLSNYASSQAEALLKLVSIYEKLGRTRDLLRTMQRLFAVNPDHAAIRNDVAYLSLLLDDSSSQPYVKAREVYALDPTLPPFAVTYALAQLKGGLPRVALNALNHVSPKRLKAPGWQAVYAATLAANGRRSEAIRIAHKIDEQYLKPEEKKLISDLLKNK